MRTLATIALLFSLAASQGCVITSIVKEKLDSCGTTRTLADPQAAWRLDPEDPYQGGAVLAVRFARSAERPRSAPGKATLTDAPIVARYAWRAHPAGTASPLEIDSVEAAEDFRVPLGCPPVPIGDPRALVPPGARPMDALLPPDRARLDGDVRPLKLERDETSGAAIAAEVVVLPLTFVLDMALLPVYGIAYGARAIASN